MIILRNLELENLYFVMSFYFEEHNITFSITFQSTLEYLLVHRKPKFMSTFELNYSKSIPSWQKSFPPVKLPLKV